MKHTHNIYAIPCKSGFYKTVKCVTSENIKVQKDPFDLLARISASLTFHKLWKGFKSTRSPTLVAKIYE